MSNRRVIKINGAVLKSLGNQKIDSFCGVPVMCGVKTYPITYSLTNASVSPQPTKIREGQTITYTILFDYDNSQRESATGATLTSLGNNQYKLSNPTGAVTVIASSSQDAPCLLKDTEVLLADGTTKLIQDITYNDLVLTYNPYLKRFIGEYPCVITEAPHEHITNNFKRVSFDDGNYLDIACLHTVLIKENDKYDFNKVSVWDKQDSILNKDAVYYENGEVKTHKVISIDNLSNTEKVSAYNVFVPMHGTIITNNVFTGGNYLVSKSALDKGVTKDKSKIDKVSSYLTDEYILNDYNTLCKIFTDLPFDVYVSSFLSYYNLCNEIIGDTQMSEEDKNGLKYTLSLWKGFYKERDKECNVKIDDIIYKVNAGDTFTFPDTYQTYLDTSNYKTYKAGDKKIVYISEVIVGIDND